MASIPIDAGRDTAASATGSEPELLEAHHQQAPTASHALAEDEDAPSAATRRAGEEVRQQDEIEVKNLGWNRDEGTLAPHMVRGLRNEELWTLVRRFDKQIFHVKTIDEPPLANLDLNVADEEEFSPDKLRAQLERLYMVVLVALFSAWKHVVRLRSWRERRRTAGFLAVYVVAWFLDLLMPTVSAFLMVLILYPPARDYCFPPAPPSLIDPNTGGVKKPAAGVLASDDSMTGAPEKHKGEAVEQEAHSFVNSLSTVCSGVLPLIYSLPSYTLVSPNWKNEISDLFFLNRLSSVLLPASIPKETLMRTTWLPILRS